MSNRNLTFVLLGAFAAGAACVILLSFTVAPVRSHAATPTAADQEASASAPEPGTTRPADSAVPPGAGYQRRPADVQHEIADERRTVIVEAVETVGPSVASVVISGVQRYSSLGPSMFPRDFFDSFFSPFPSRERRVTVQSGSAVLISDDGEVLTNSHVIAAADQVSLMLPDGRLVEAEVLGSSAMLDVALLRVEAFEGMRPAHLGRADDLVVGEWLVAVGFPIGGPSVSSASRFQPTVTVGVVSAVDRSFVPPDTRGRRTEREVTYYPDMIQTDAAINPGNSGGPLANALGEVVGLNTFIITESGGSEGLGFAIPIERALRAAEEIRNYGEVRAVDLGQVRLQEVTADLAEALDLDAAHGMLIAEVSGASAEAGLEEGDVLLDVDGKTCNSLLEVRLALIPRFVGDTVSLGVWRDGRRIELSILLEADQD
jgi:serine protease Do